MKAVKHYGDFLGYFVMYLELPHESALWLWDKIFYRSRTFDVLDNHGFAQKCLCFHFSSRFLFDLDLILDGSAMDLDFYKCWSRYKSASR